jgi:hypothetical protein
LIDTVLANSVYRRAVPAVASGGHPRTASVCRVPALHAYGSLDLGLAAC